jgi:hypothetical protein
MTSAIKYGEGLHITQIDPENLDALNIRGISSVLLTIACQGLSKTSLALTMLHLTMGKLRYLIWFILVSMNIFSALACIFFCVNCTPMAKVWIPETQGTCWDFNVVVNFAVFSSCE